ncbi:MAG: hypothetical protein C0508_12075 [Cyanobacteria bacterium PR.023]|jgi:hypothetical protein|nr:hypothetical protein [Cyanobacteria bacterium PR.023]
MGRDCDPCDNRNGRGINPESPRDLARELDNGNARTVMDALQRDAYTMQPRQFEQTVRQLAQIENPRFGDNLAVSNRGDIVINRADGQRFCIGNIYRQEEMADAYARRHDGNYSRDIPRQPIVDPRYQPEPYYGRQDPRYRYPDVATPPFYPDEQYGRHGRNGRVYDPGFDPRYGNNRGYNDRNLGQEIVRDGVVGAIVGRGSGGDALKGAGINILLNQVFRPRGY